MANKTVKLQHWPILTDWEGGIKLLKNFFKRRFVINLTDDDWSADWRVGGGSLRVSAFRLFICKGKWKPTMAPKPHCNLRHPDSEENLPNLRLCSRSFWIRTCRGRIKKSDDVFSKKLFRWFLRPPTSILPAFILSFQSCPTLCDPMDCSPPGFSVHRDSPGKNTRVGCHSLLQGIFLTQEWNPHFLHWRQILYCWATGEAHTHLDGLKLQALLIVQIPRHGVLGGGQVLHLNEVPRWFSYRWVFYFLLAFDCFESGVSTHTLKGKTLSYTNKTSLSLWLNTWSEAERAIRTR